MNFYLYFKYWISFKINDNFFLYVYVAVGVVTYLTQLLDTGFFHADPHPGNMLRSPDGRLVILDFGLMTQITENQKYGMVEAIAHLIHR